jgi:hypothetical protein
MSYVTTNDIFGLYDRETGRFVKIGFKVAWPNRSAAKAAYDLHFTDRGKNGVPGLDEQSRVEAINLGKFFTKIEHIMENSYEWRD